MENIFWLSLILILYTYAGYPLFLFLASKLFKKPVRKKANEPQVSIILAAFNEEKAIEQKLLNLLELDYPETKLEILVGSDGGSDQTDEIISHFHSTRIRFFRFIKNFGKPHVLKALAEEARGEILLFTDARQEFDHDAVRALVANFEDPKVGCVSGELYLKQASDGVVKSIGGGMDAYWRYEKFLRKRESELGSMLGATGAIYAIRASLFPKSLPDDILVDFSAPEACAKACTVFAEEGGKAVIGTTPQGKYEAYINGGTKNTRKAPTNMTMAPP